MSNNNENTQGREFLGIIDPHQSAFDRAKLCVRIAKANGGSATVDGLQKIAAKYGEKFSDEQLEELLAI